MKTVEEHKTEFKRELTLGALKQLENETVKGNCEICRKETDIKLSYVHLWFYGERKQVQRYMCKTCVSLESRGKL